MDIGIGKRRGLQATSSERGLFTILAFDHRGSLRRAMCPQSPDTVSYSDVVSFKLEVLSALAPRASGVLLDPIYGAAQAVAAGGLPGHVGLLVAVEEKMPSLKSTVSGATSRTKPATFLALAITLSAAWKIAVMPTAPEREP